MEPKEKEHINANLAALIENTTVNELLLAKLQGVKMLSNIDKETVKAKGTPSAQAEQLYKIMITKANGYIPLVNALRDTLQSGAYNILLTVSSEMIKNLRVGSTQTVGDLLSSEHIAEIETWVNDNPSCDERQKVYETIFKQTKEPNLWRETIPAPHSLYIPRYLSRRHAVDPKLFEKSIQDIFVFKDIQRAELREFVKSYDIESSTSQLLRQRITARLILLNNDSHWKLIRGKVQYPVHLIKYENGTQTFLLEATSGVSTELRQFLKNNDTKSPEDVSEDVFVEKIATGLEKGVCICDVPGMGKSLLLANIAREICNKFPDRFVVFIELRNLVLPIGALTPEVARSVILKYVSETNFAFHTLNKIIKNNNDIKLELFFDGLDEVKENHLEQTTAFFCKIYEGIPQARIYVTSRPVARDKLEKSIGAIAYDIVGFNEPTQQQYIISCWKNILREKKSDVKLDSERLYDYACKCLKCFKANLKPSEMDIAGIPLQCYLIAKVYSEKAIIYAGSKNDVPLELNFVNSLWEIYTEFMLRQLGESKCNFECMYKQQEIMCNTKCQVRSFHVWKSIQLIFPKIANYLTEKIRKFGNLTWQNKLSPGLLKKCENKETKNTDFEFVHRTFAEYLVAEYFTSVVFSKRVPQQHTLQQLVFDQIYKCGTWGYIKPTDTDKVLVCRLAEQVVAYFLNAMLAKNKNTSFDILCEAKLSSCPEFLCTIQGCMLEDSSGLLDIYLKAVENTQEKSQGSVRQSFERFLNDLNTNNETLFYYNILGVAAATYTTEIVQRMCQFFLNYLKIDLINPDYYYVVPIEMAIRRGEYKLAEYFAETMPLEGCLMISCVADTYFESEELVDKKLDIGRMLLKKRPTILTDPKEFGNYIHPILADEIHLKAIKFLVENGVDCRETGPDKENVIYTAARYMTEEDFTELCNFVDGQCDINYFLDSNRLSEFLFENMFESDQKTKRLLKILQYLSTKCGSTEVDMESVRPSFLSLQIAPVVNFLNIFRRFNSKSSETTTDPDQITTNSSVEDQWADETFKTFFNTRLYQSYKQIFLFLFWAAVYEGYTKIVEQMLSLDTTNLHVGVTVKLESESVPLLFCAGSGEMFQLLVNKGACIYDVDEKGRTILHYLLEKGRKAVFYDVVKYLGTLWNKTAFTWKLPSTDRTKPKILLELFNWPKTGSLETPLHSFLRSASLNKDNLDKLDLFLKGGNLKSKLVVNVNAVDGKGNTALHYGLRCDVEVIQRLVCHGMDVTVKNENGCNLTHICAQKGQMEPLKYFLELGVDANELDNEGNNALQCGLNDLLNEKLTQVEFMKVFEALLDANVKKCHANSVNQTAYDILKLKLNLLKADKEFLKENWDSFRKRLKVNNGTEEDEYIETRDLSDHSESVQSETDDSQPDDRISEESEDLVSSCGAVKDSESEDSEVEDTTID